MLGAARKSAARPAEASGALELNRRILLVDDNPAIHDDIRKILCPPSHATPALDRLEADLFDEAPTSQAHAHYHIDSAFQGREALELLRTARQEGQPYALAFVDVRMPPGWDGIETISHLWREDPDLQVVICTAYSDHSWGEIIKRLAPTDGLLILRKPFDGVEIRQLAHALTAKWMLRQQVRQHLRELQDQVNHRTRELYQTEEKLRRESAERERIETELRLAQKLEAVGLVTSGISHEISTPVQFVGESVELLRHAFASLRAMNARFRAALESIGTEAMRRAITEAEASVSLQTIETDIAESLDRMLEGTSRITTIVRAMKEFMHPPQREKAPADLNRALLNTLTVARNEYKYVARLETNLEPLPLVNCHVGDLNQVFLNLIVNAAHAIGDVVAIKRVLGLIIVRSRRDGDHVVFEISDNGTGIPPEARHRIFEPFFTTKEVGKGTGQGLSIARAIVADRHRGSLTFETELGRGTTFRVRLPIESPP